MNILIVGSGNIGYRHAQKLHRIKEVKKIFFFDKNKKKYTYIKKLIISGKIFFLQNLNLKQIKIDLAIIATTVENRYLLLKRIIKEKPKLKNIILEKIVFLKKIHYSKIISLAETKKINIFTNYPRLYYKFYIKLKKLTREKKIVIRVKGSNWNMLSNIVHFLNLFEFLNLNNKITFIEEKNNYQLIKSNRVGYNDLLGKITFTNSIGSKLILINLKNSKKSSIEIESNDFNIFFNEENDNVYIKNKLKDNLKIFYKHKPSVLQSNITYKIVKDLIKNNEIQLQKINDTFLSDFVFIDFIEFLENKFQQKLYIT